MLLFFFYYNNLDETDAVQNACYDYWLVSKFKTKLFFFPNLIQCKLKLKWEIYFWTKLILQNQRDSLNLYLSTLKHWILFYTWRNWLLSFRQWRLVPVRRGGKWFVHMRNQSVQQPFLHVREKVLILIPAVFSKNAGCNLDWDM